jgi:hypothetical protein
MSKKKVQVFVWDEPHIITVYRKSKAVWIAQGVYRGTSLTVEDQSEDAAMKRWRYAAEFTQIRSVSA